MREIARLQYVVKTADRGAGFIQAERKRSGGAMALFGNVSYFSELAIVVIPGAPGTTTQISVSPTSSKQEGGSQRTSSGMSLTKDIQQDADSVVRACSAP